MSFLLPDCLWQYIAVQLASLLAVSEKWSDYSLTEQCGKFLILLIWENLFPGTIKTTYFQQSFYSEIYFLTVILRYIN